MFVIVSRSVSECGSCLFCYCDMKEPSYCVPVYMYPVLMSLLQKQIDFKQDFLPE